MALNLVLHLVALPLTNNLMFDEKHYVVDARHIAYDHYSDRNEHPPLGKLLITAGIMVFGDNVWGWRVPSVLAGVLAIVSFYLICRALELSRRGSSLATLIFGTETLTFLMSSVAMLDIFMVAFMMLGFALYLRGNYPLSALAMVLSALCKMTGLFGLGAIAVHWLIMRRKAGMRFAVPFATAGAGFSLVMWMFDPHVLNNVLNALTQMQTLTFTAVPQEAASHAWQWVLSLEGMVFNRGPTFIGIISLTVWALIIPMTLYMAYYAIKKRDSLSIFGLAWFAATYLVWLPLDVLTDRVTFLFYFLPAVGAVVLGMGRWIEGMLREAKDKDARVVSGVFTGLVVAAHLFLFAMFVPPLNQYIPLASRWIA